MKTQNKAFTLVELIIVITVLAILATIGFMSFQSYTIDARDGKRKRDLGTLRSGLEIYQAKKSTLPDPDPQTVSIMSGGILISTQGYAGASVLQTLRASDIKDPSDKSYYTYIVNSDKTKYQLLSMLENNTNLVLSNNLLNETYARDYTARYAYTTGNKVGVFFSGTTNIPLQETMSGDLDLTDATNSTKLFKVMFSNSTANSGTIISTGTSLPAQIQTIINSVASTVSTPTTPTPSTPVATTCPAGQGYNGTSCVTATSCNSTLTEITLANGQTWSCKNLGATTVRDGATQPADCGVASTTNCNSSLTWLGDYYQWGRNDTGFTIGQWASPYNNGWEAQNDTKWGGSSSDTATADGAGTTKEGRQGPCLTGRHVPSPKDFQDMCNTVTNSTCTYGMTYNANIQSVLKIPSAGYRNGSNGYYTRQGLEATYWSSSPSDNLAFYLYITTSSIYPTDFYNREDSYSVRCLKN